LLSLLDIARRGERTLVMGILNVTPDSFSDGGRFFNASSAIAAARQMVDDGADIIDVGGESTRPGSEPVSPEEEIRRVLPVIEAIGSSVSVSIDTTKAAVARESLSAGAVMVNDISGMTFDAEMARLVAETRAPVCLMHMRGSPSTMQSRATYGDVVREVKEELSARIAGAKAEGVRDGQIVIDPGFGFAKLAEHNLEIVRRLREFCDLRYPILIGPSRKSTIGKVLGGLPAEERLEGTAALVALSIANGASIVRVHDVKEMARVVRMTDAVVRGWSEEGSTKVLERT
jgi:dihydropteroate synthase